MNIEQIRFIEAIVEEGSFRKAAEKLYISQPAVSSSIKKLESELNIDLFDKDTYRATLTEEGRIFYKKAIKVLDDFKNLEEFAQSLKIGIEPEIKIAIDPIFNMKDTLNILNNIMASFPETIQTISVDYMENIVNHFKNKNFDLLICPINHIEKLDMDVEKLFLGEVILYTVISPTCSLAKKEIITKEDLKYVPQVFIKINRENTSNILDKSRSWYVNDFYLKKLIIMEGLAYGMIPEFFMIEELKEGKLIPLTKYEDFEIVKLKIFAFRNKNIKHGIVAESIWKALQN